MIDEIIKKKIGTPKGAKILDIRSRQMFQLKKWYKAEGVKAIISNKRGCPTNHRFKRGIKEVVAGLIEDNYGSSG